MISISLVKRFGRWVSLVVLLCMPAYASAAGTISQGYKTLEAMPIGSLVSTDPANVNTVELANSDRVSRLVGVVGDKPLIELSGSAQDIQVVTGGSTQALVSDINGQIKAGDKITASPILGVGMKANQSTEIVGIAEADLATTAASERTVTDRSGQTQTVKIGTVPVRVNVEYYAYPNNAASSLLPPIVQTTANNLVGRSVSPLRVLASLLILVFGIGAITIILYTATRSSVTSIGRNPLAQTAIRKGFLEILAMSVAIFVLAIMAAYIVLKL